MVFPCRSKLSSNVAYKHSSLVPRDADIQNYRLFVGRLRVYVLGLGGLSIVAFFEQCVLYVQVL